MTKRNKMLTSYLCVMLCLTIVRICFSEGIFGELSEVDTDRLFSTLAQIACMGIIPLIALFFTSKKKNIKAYSKRLGLRPLNKGKTVLLVIGISLLHPVINGGVSTVWGYLVRLTGYTSTVSDPEVYLNVGDFLLGVFFSAVLPAFFEEITHRCLAFRMTKGGEVKKILITSLLFALMHQNVMQTGYTFIGGLTFGALVVLTGSIFPAMLAHFFNNLCVTVRIYISSCEDTPLYTLLNSFMEFGATTLGAVVYTVIWIIAVGLSLLFFVKLHRLNEDKITYASEIEEEERDSDRVLSVVLWIAIFAIGAITTVYSYIWGLMR